MNEINKHAKTNKSSYNNFQNTKERRVIRGTCKQLMQHLQKPSKELTQNLCNEFYQKRNLKQRTPFFDTTATTTNPKLLKRGRRYSRLRTQIILIVYKKLMVS